MAKKIMLFSLLGCLLVLFLGMKADVQAGIKEEFPAEQAVSTFSEQSAEVITSGLSGGQVPEVVALPKAGGVPPTGGVPPAEAPPCPCCGIIWHAENQESGETYGESPIGGLNEKCWIVGQVWTETVFGDQVVPERWTFAIRPGTVIWIRGHRGGTAWYFSGTEGAVWEDIKRQAEELRVRDGEMQTGILMLPDQASQFRLLTRLQTANS